MMQTMKIWKPEKAEAIELKVTIGFFPEGSSSGSAQRETKEIDQAKEETPPEISMAKGNATESTETIHELNKTAEAKEGTPEISMAKGNATEITKAIHELKLMMMWLLRRKKKPLKCRRQRRKKETKERMAKENEETDESTEAKGEQNESALEKVESSETVEAKEETNDVAGAVDEPNEAAELKEETNEAGDSNETMQRANALDPKLGVLHDECAKSAVEWCINTLRAGHAITFHEMATVAARLGAFNKEGELMLVECAKSAAELCIKNMRLGVLVDKLDKMTLLKGEIHELRKTKVDLGKRFIAFKRNLTANNVGSTENKFKMKECSSCDGKVVVRSYKDLNLSFLERQYVRVLSEMVKGNGFGEILEDHEVDEAMTLAETWVHALYWKCAFKACVGVLIDNQTVAEALKSEIAEAWRMEKEVNDKLVIYEKKHARGRDTVVADIVGEKSRLHKVGVYAAAIRCLVVVYLLCWPGVDQYGPWQKVSLLLVVWVFSWVF